MELRFTSLSHDDNVMERTNKQAGQMQQAQFQAFNCRRAKIVQSNVVITNRIMH